MKSTEDANEFKPSTYCDNVSAPLLERIRELESELTELKKQVRTLKIEKAFSQRLPVNDAIPRVHFYTQGTDSKEVEPV